jgi:hypothetical protein
METFTADMSPTFTSPATKGRVEGFPVDAPVYTKGFLSRPARPFLRRSANSQPDQAAGFHRETQPFPLPPHSPPLPPRSTFLRPAHEGSSAPPGPHRARRLPDVMGTTCSVHGCPRFPRSSAPPARGAKTIQSRSSYATSHHSWTAIASERRPGLFADSAAPRSSSATAPTPRLPLTGSSLS